MLEIECNSQYVTRNSFKKTNPPKNIGKKFLTKKRKFIEEDDLILTKEEANEEILKPFKKAYLMNFPMFNENSLSSEDEILTVSSKFVSSNLFFFLSVIKNIKFLGVIFIPPAI